MVAWLFQANPKYSQILEAIQKLDGIYWLVTRYNKEITPSDRVLIWIAGKQAGIYATAEVSEAPLFMDQPPDIDIWTMPIRAKARFYTPVTFQQKLLDAPLLKSVLIVYQRIEATIFTKVNTLRTVFSLLSSSG